MILADTSVWIDHFRTDDLVLRRQLEERRILSHPAVYGEIALGTLRDRAAVLFSFGRLPKANVARDEEVFEMIERHRLFGIGIGFVDAHLIASVRLTPPSVLWTRDKRLRGVAHDLGLAADLS